MKSGNKSKYGSYCPRCLRCFKGQSVGTHAVKCGVSQVELFWTKVEKTEGCWLFHGGKKQDGYGLIRLQGGKMVQAHRLSWEVANGPVPDGLCVLHRCDVRACVNPSHLFLGDRKLNGEDMAQKGRSTRGEKNWNAVLTVDQVREIRASYVFIHRRKTNQPELAKKYGVSPATINGIVNRRIWKHIP